MFVAKLLGVIFICQFTYIVGAYYPTSARLYGLGYKYANAYGIRQPMQTVYDAVPEQQHNYGYAATSDVVPNYASTYGTEQSGDEVSGVAPLQESTNVYAPSIDVGSNLADNHHEMGEGTNLNNDPSLVQPSAYLTQQDVESTLTGSENYKEQGTPTNYYTQARPYQSPYGSISDVEPTLTGSENQREQGTPTNYYTQARPYQSPYASISEKYSKVKDALERQRNLYKRIYYYLLKHLRSNRIIPKAGGRLHRRPQHHHHHLNGPAWASKNSISLINPRISPINSTHALVPLPVHWISSGGIKLSKQVESTSRNDEVTPTTTMEDVSTLNPESTQAIFNNFELNTEDSFEQTTFEGDAEAVTYTPPVVPYNSSHAVVALPFYWVPPRPEIDSVEEDDGEDSPMLLLGHQKEISSIFRNIVGENPKRKVKQNENSSHHKNKREINPKEQLSAL